MKTIVNSIIKRYVQGRHFFLDRAINNPFISQKDVFERILFAGNRTIYGKEHLFDKVENQNDFRKIVPVGNYESHQPIYPSNDAWRSRRPMAGKNSLVF